MLDMSFSKCHSWYVNLDMLLSPSNFLHLTLIMSLSTCHFRYVYLYMSLWQFTLDDWLLTCHSWHFTLNMSLLTRHSGHVTFNMCISFTRQSRKILEFQTFSLVTQWRTFARPRWAFALKKNKNCCTDTQPGILQCNNCNATMPCLPS